VTIKKITYPSIIIGGRKHEHNTFKIHELEDDEVPRILETILSVGDFARKKPDSSDIRLIISNSPLHRIEGLVRHQLNRLLSDKYISIDDLKTYSDFDHEEEFMRDYNCIKTSFLFNFLRDLVRYRCSPEYIDQQAIDKLECNLRGLFFLAESQLTGGNKYKNETFKFFARIIWQKSGLNKLTANDFLHYALKELRKHPYKLHFKAPSRQAFAHNHEKKEEVYIARQEPKGNISFFLKSSKKPIKPLITKGWLARNWPKIQKEFNSIKK